MYQKRSGIFKSSLFDENTFYPVFLKDLKASKKEIIIESPFITSERTKPFISLFQKLLDKGIRIYVMTKDPREHEDTMNINWKK